MIPFLLLQGTVVKSEERLSQLEGFLGSNSEEPQPFVVFQQLDVSEFPHSFPVSV